MQHTGRYRVRHVTVSWAFTLLIGISLLSGGHPISTAAAVQGGEAPGEPLVQGPMVGEPVEPFLFDGVLSQIEFVQAQGEAQSIQPLKYVPGTEPKGGATTIAGWVDPIAQTAEGAGRMPSPVLNFAGMSLYDGGAGWPPDTNGDVGPNHFIQTVNTSIAIYTKTGVKQAQFTFNAFFQGTGTPCDNQNSGDPVVVYDRLADRWVITDFAIPGPYYECIAISRSGDPVNGGWYMYGVKISDVSLNDYPKFGVWPDAYYMSANMFFNRQGWDGVQVWAFNRDDMLAGRAVRSVHFSLAANSGYGSLLPSHMLSAPPAGSPNYFASVAPPDKFQLWKFQVNWANPGNSTFAGPVELEVADFAIAASVPQKDSDRLLDSLSYRPMMQLQYRQVNGVEALWLNHTVASQGVGAVRWYEVRGLSGTPSIFQQGTYQPDSNHRWMGALAVDKDGNMAVGYSVSSSNMYPGIRYAGRLAGEAPGSLPQAEVSLIEGSGSQITYSRWGDYSSMSVDPVDDCTFWYTTEYYAATGVNWQTRIGTFKFASCGQAQGYIEGYVRNSVTNAAIPGVKVVGQSSTLTISVLTDATGKYRMALPSNTYTLTAGPLPPAYPNPASVPNVTLVAPNTVSRDILLTPVPNLVGGVALVDDTSPFNNGNGYPEPGEQGLKLTLTLHNNGATAATGVTGRLIPMTPGMTVQQGQSSYPDIPQAQSRTNSLPFVFSLGEPILCGDDLDFRLVMESDQGSFIADFRLNASVPEPRQDIFSNNVEGGTAGWMPGGFFSQWAITTLQSHSPSHSWTDSPLGNYPANSDTYVRTPAYNLTGKRHLQLSGWFRYELEAGYDYTYLEASLDGGATWESDPLASFNGSQLTWVQHTVNLPALDDRPNVAFRFRLVTDPGVEEDGVYIDDVALSYEPFGCSFVPSQTPGAPLLIFPEDGGFDYNPVTFAWAQGETGHAPTGYRLTVDGTEVFTYTTTVTTTVIPSLSLGQHTWFVTAFNEDGFSPPSETRTLEVLAVQAGLPGVPVLLSPANGSTTGLQTVAFRWRADRNAGTPQDYTFLLDGATEIALDGRLSVLTLVLPPGLHTWTVRAENGEGASAYAQTWTFRVPYLIFAPFLKR